MKKSHPSLPTAPQSRRSSSPTGRGAKSGASNAVLGACLLSIGLGLAVILLPVVFAAQPFGTNLGSFNGVTSFSNGSSSHYSGLSNTVNGIYTGIKWQCVEYIRRYYLSAYGMNLGALYRGNANTWYDNASKMGLDRYPNGSTTAPQIGDIITSNGGSFGHVAIIRSVSGTQVCTTQQNFSNDSTDVNRCLSLSISNGTYNVGGFSASYPIRGWLRKPGTTPPAPCDSGTSESYRVDGGPPLHPNGTLIMERNVSTVYVLQNGQRRPISSPDVLHYLYNGENGEFDFSDVIFVASDEMSRYPIGPGVFSTLPSNGRSQPDGRLIKQVGGGEISLVTDGGRRRPFSSESIFLGLGYKYCGVVEVSDYNSYPAGPIVLGREGLPTVTTSMSLSPSGPYNTGQNITASFSITNRGNASITFSQLLAGGRLGGSTITDFAPQSNVTLTPNQRYDYQASRSFSTAGSYQFFPAYQTPDGIWRLSLNNEVGVASGVVSVVNATVNSVPIPPAPTANAATGVTTGGFTANWGGSAGATGYRLDVSTSSTFGSFLSGYQNLDVGNVTSRGLSGLSPDTTYYYRARAYNSAGTSGSSNTVSVKTAAQGHTINVSASPSQGGTAGGGGTFTAGNSCTVTATPNSGYVFSNWTEGGGVVSSSASYTFNVTGSRTLVANFNASPVNYTITLSASPGAGGTVGGGGSFAAGSSRTVTAAANAGYAFSNWTEGGSVISSSASYTFTLNSDRNLVANFTASPSNNGGLQYYPLPAPVRLYDTRPGQPACINPSSPLAAGSAASVTARGPCASIPAAALAVVGNATVVNNAPASAPGFVTLYPSGAARPVVSNINYAAGQVLSNAFTIGLGPDGAFNAYAHSAIDLIVDVSGYYAPPGAGGLYFHPLPQPVRLLDTRIGQSACDAPGAPITAGGTRSELARLACGGVVIPSDALAVVGNATVVNNNTGSGPGFLTFFPGGAAWPAVSSLNYAAGQVLSNAFVVGLGGDGRFNIYAHSTVDVIVDVTGYYSASVFPDSNGASGLLYLSLATPFRLLDTRAGEPACHNPGAPLTAGTASNQQATGTCGAVTIPAGAEALVGNATVVNTTAGSEFGFITLYPEGAARPLVSNINYGPGQVLSNAFTVRLGAGGAFTVFPLSTTHYITDVTGYFVPTTPSRP